MPPGIELGTSRAEDLSLTPDGAFLAPRAHIVVLALVLARARGSNPGPPIHTLLIFIRLRAHYISMC